MTAVWMVQCACIAVLIAIAAWGFESAAKHFGRPLRWIWSAALLMTLVLTFLLPWRTEPAPVASKVVVGTLAPAQPSVTLLSKVRDVLTTVQHAFQAATQTIVAPSRMLVSAIDHAPARNSAWLAAFWFFATAAVASAMLWVYASFRSSRKLWPLAKLHSIVVRISPSTGPLVVGLANAEIVVPHWLLARDAAEQRMVLEHEQEHLAARDPLLLALACFAVVILPWNPAVWWMLARLRLAVELDCDRRLLRRGISIQSYGELLIDLTGHRSGLRLAVPAFACSTSHLERRLVAMTSKRPRHIVLRTIALSAVGALALVAACESKMPTSADAAAAKTATPKEPETAAKVATDATIEVPLAADSSLLKKMRTELGVKKLVKGVPVFQTEIPRDDSQLTLKQKQMIELKAMERAKVLLRSENVVQGSPLFRTDDKLTVQEVPQVLNLKRQDGLDAVKQDGAVRVQGVRLTDAVIEQGSLTLRADTLELKGTQKGFLKIRGRPEEQPLFIVDGVIVSDSALGKLSPEQIESIRVNKRNVTPDGHVTGEVVITTKAVVKPKN